MKVFKNQYVGKILEIWDNLKTLTDNLCSLEILKKFTERELCVINV